MNQTVRRARHPGTVLLKFIEAKGMSQKEFASLIDKTTTDLNYIIKGKRNINIDYALRFEIALGISHEVRLGMQKDYDVYINHISKQRQIEYENIKIKLQNKKMTLPVMK